MDLNTPEGRLQTFRNWPSNHPLRPKLLAEAGQYYTGEDEKTDETRCCACGGRICNWEAGDDPYKEHKSKFPDCTLSQHPETVVCFTTIWSMFKILKCFLGNKLYI